MRIKQLYGRLLEKHGPQGWWPTRKTGYHPLNKSRKLSENEMLEICIGAILTQNTAWKNVEKALANLISSNALDLKKLAVIKQSKLAQLIRSSGYYNQKAERLQLFARHVLKEHGSFSRMFRKDLEPLREELLSLKGIGPETADSMLLYAGRKPVFVIDAYTKRICSRLGICEADADYHELQSKFHSSLPPDAELFNEFHALFVEEGKK
jgi:endonuclease-3 related protein